MVLCHKKLGPVEKVEVEDELSMKKKFGESGWKLMGSHKLGRAQYMVMVDVQSRDKA